MKSYEAFLAFIGDFSPVFFITYMVYLGYSLSCWLIPLIIAFLCNLIWIKILGEKELKNSNESREETFEISEVKDIGLDVIAYFLSYSIALPTILFLPAYKGILILSVILSLVYILFSGNKIMLFNPFLTVFGYREYEVRTKKGSTFYIISKEHLKEEGWLTVFRIYPFIYYYESVIDVT